MIDEKEFKEDGIFGSRGIDRDVADGAFFPYAKGDWPAILAADPNRKESQQLKRLAARSKGIVMRRWSVPEGDEFIHAELRPDHAIWTGGLSIHEHDWLGKYERVAHVRPSRSPTDADKVRRGMTPKEFDEESRKRGFGVTGGGDHFGVDTTRKHRHYSVPKYLFSRNATAVIVDPDTLEDGEPAHAHSDYDEDEPWLWRHLRSEHGGREVARAANRDFESLPEELDTNDRMREAAGLAAIWSAQRWPRIGRRLWEPRLDEVHTHERRVDVTRYAQRLSIHPKSLARLDDDHRERVCFALEGCLKEAALVTAGEVTFSCPSVSLWNAPELPDFVRNHLVGRTVLVICDSDWKRDDDNSVLDAALSARDALRTYGADAHMVAPPMGGDDCKHKDKKHGVDDFLGPCMNGKVDDMTHVERETPYGLAEWIADTGRRAANGKALRDDGIERDALVLRHLSTHASEDGTSRFVASTVADALRPEFERLDGETSDHDARKQRVCRAVDSLVGAGVLEEVIPLRENRRRRYRKVHYEYKATFRVLPYELRASSRLRDVRELSR